MVLHSLPRFLDKYYPHNCSPHLYLQEKKINQIQDCTAAMSLIMLSARVERDTRKLPLLSQLSTMKKIVMQSSRINILHLILIIQIANHIVMTLRSWFAKPNHNGWFAKPNKAGWLAKPNHTGRFAKPNHTGRLAKPNHTGWFAKPNHSVWFAKPNHNGWFAKPNHTSTNKTSTVFNFIYLAQFVLKNNVLSSNFIALWILFFSINGTLS